MKAFETNLLEFLRAPKQFIIPIYQRIYSWNLTQCQQLWLDIVRVGKDDTAQAHFVGSIVYIAKGIYNVSNVPQLLLIDGQQRLTTLSLLLAAVAEVLGDDEQDVGINRRRVGNYYLFNSEEEGDLYYKLLLTQNDKETLKRVLQGREMPEQSSTRVVENYKFFVEKLRKSGVPLRVVYEGIKKLLVVEISLDREKDNPQLIFESLNSTGLELSQADLIRNYVLMGLEPQEQAKLYEDCWLPMEQVFGQEHYVKWFDWFIRDFLTVRTGNISNVREVYTKFKSYCQSENAPDALQAIVLDLYCLSKYYVRFVLAKEPDALLKQVFADINTLTVNVAFPFFLKLYEDYENKILAKQEFITILRLVESYVFRRLICGIPTNSLNNTFASLMKEVDKADYLNSIQIAMVLKDSYRRFPSDQEFSQELLVKDVYRLRNRNYLLAKLENHGRREAVMVETYTIEHILPQNPNLRIEWQTALGVNWQEIQGKYLHNLGNLTLTGYNSEYSDRPFSEKRDMIGGFRESPLRLNQGLGQLGEWNENTLCDRAKRLAEKAVRVWAYPSVSPNVLAQYQIVQTSESPEQHTLEEHTNFMDSEVLPLFEEFRKRVLNMDSSVREEPKKTKIAYKIVTNFVDVNCQKKRLLLILNMEYTAINDPMVLCKDVTDKGTLGYGNVAVYLEHIDQIDAVMALVQQAFDKQME